MTPSWLLLELHKRPNAALTRGSVLSSSTSPTPTRVELKEIASQHPCLFHASRSAGPSDLWRTAAEGTLDLDSHGSVRSDETNQVSKHILPDSACVGPCADGDQFPRRCESKRGRAASSSLIRMFHRSHWAGGPAALPSSRFVHRLRKLRAITEGGAAHRSRSERGGHALGHRPNLHKDLRRLRSPFNRHRQRRQALHLLCHEALLVHSRS